MSPFAQNAVALVIVASAAAYLGWRMSGPLFRKRSSSSCGGCAGCERSATSPNEPSLVSIEPLATTSPGATAARNSTTN